MMYELQLRPSKREISMSSRLLANVLAARPSATSGSMRFATSWLSAILCLASCSAAGCVVHRSDASPAEVTQWDLTKPGPNKVAQTFTRDRGMLGGAIDYQLYIGELLVARLGTAETVTIYLAPGEYLLRFRTVTGDFGDSFPLVVENGPARAYRVTSRQQIVPVAL